MLSTNELARDKAARLLKRGGGGGGGPSSVSSSSLDQNTRYLRRSESVSTISYADEPSQYEAPKKPVRLENTYQLKPSKSFPSGQVERIMKDVMEGYLGNEQYNPELCRSMTKTVSEVVRSRVKELSIPRFKIICLVHIGQLADQGMRIASRCLWDHAVDQFATFELKNNSLFAVCTVYAVYHD